ncbi:hypothetical protein B1219_29635 [Pseudomonas ogarae]|uniref:hypothetical protein n=1 Tax=Pseudomonas ogarae (strain DSM 112162 / CECT 30235 / F113) TaxID=1114970 RepID=UPI0009A465EC|nr:MULTISPECIES: hypothetical protein [Pseudomonas]OPG68830.1 hypothetical protein B1219_29635 [Pseudomonas ogarae]OPG76257.1 hypothetical protein B1218_27070 [Pseudomonas ogarae]PBJ02822.1 hypothetical protein BSF43_48800 [Pseudomonas ogarae]PBJ26865.1 hypothetical protein BSG18_00020 [Pseudomonas ogarae]QXH93565.1 hypothetical protein HU749_022385 [Pseudomonas zarinae]
MPDNNASRRLPDKPIVSVLLSDSPDWDESGLLPADLANKPLSVEILAWVDTAFPGRSSYLRVYWDNSILVYEKDWTASEWGSGNSPPPADLFFDIEAQHVTHGVHELKYEVTLFNGNSDPSQILTITIDEVPPSLDSDSQLLIDTDHITEQYLIDNGDKVQAGVPAYTRNAPGDIITWYWSKDPFNVVAADEVASRTLYRSDSGQPLPLDFPGDMILVRGDGDFYAFYRLQDRAGNFSPYSTAYPLRVDATPIPRDLPWPRVENASGTGEQQTLAPLNFLSGAVVVIPDTAVIYPQEKVWVQWSEPDSVGQYRTDREISAGSRRYEIPMSSIAAYIGKTLPLSYSVIDNKENELPSVPRRLNIQTIASSDFPTVQCQGLSGGDLSLRSVPETGAELTLARWVMMTTDQWIMVNMTGVGASGEVEFTAIRKRPVTQQEVSFGVGQRRDVTVSKTFLSSLRRPGSLTGKVYVSFDGGLTWPPLVSPNFPSLNLRLVD